MVLTGNSDASSREAFAQWVTQSLRAAGERRSIALDPEGFKLLVGGPNGLHLFLGRSHDVVSRLPSLEREAWILAFARAVVGSTDATDLLSQGAVDHLRLRPRIRERSYLDVRQLTVELSGQRAPPLPHQELTGSFVLFLAYDGQDSIIEMSQPILDAVGLTFDEALEAAHRALEGVSTDPFRSPHPGLYVSPWRDGFDGSRILLPDRIRSLSLKGNPVIMIPTPETLIIAGSEDPEALSAMAELAMKALDGAPLLSGVPLEFDKTEWRVHQPSPHHTHAKKIERLALATLARDYAQQEELLERWYEREGGKVVVARFKAVEDQAGRPSSYAVWSDIGPVSLPEVDQLALVQPQLPKDRAFLGPVTWKSFREVMKSSITVETRVPRRYRLNAFPSVEERRRMGLRGPSQG